MAKRDYDNDLKNAVITAVLAGQTINSAAKEFGVPKGTISGWLKQNDKELNAVRSDAGQELRGGTAETEIGGKLARYINANLDALIAQAEVMAEKDYLRGKEIENLALAHGILNDKVIRLLEAVDRAKPESDSTEN